jgi:hypothetical protein
VQAYAPPLPPGTVCGAHSPGLELRGLTVSFMQQVESFAAIGDRDTFYWEQTSKFNINTAWKAIRAKHPRFSWHRLIWFFGYVPRFFFISWLAILDRLSIKARMETWISLPSSLCDFCGSNIESRYHIFFSYPITGDI